MKKSLLVLACCALSPIVFAGFSNEGSAVSSIKQAEALPDHSYVVLDGYIVSQLKKEKYYFKDMQGKLIEVKIEDHIWNGLDVSSQDKVRIQGKTDKHWIKMQIEVQQINKMK